MFHSICRLVLVLTLIFYGHLLVEVASSLNVPVHCMLRCRILHFWTNKLNSIQFNVIKIISTGPIAHMADQGTVKFNRKIALKLSITNRHRSDWLKYVRET